MADHAMPVAAPKLAADPHLHAVPLHPAHLAPVNAQEVCGGVGTAVPVDENVAAAGGAARWQLAVLTCLRSLFAHARGSVSRIFSVRIRLCLQVALRTQQHI